MADIGIRMDAPLGSKLDFLLLDFSDQQKYWGDIIPFHPFLTTKAHTYYGAKDKGELDFYTRCLVEKGFLVQVGDESLFKSLNRKVFSEIRFTEKGVNYCISLSENGINSKKCFIAMSFSHDHSWIFQDGILPALNETSFEALKVDEDKTLKYRNNENSINDFILLSIKSCKFCIADFTGNKSGVYFEAGYALAKDKQVIYTCLDKEFKEVHFDTNRFPFIRYTTAEELKDKLVNRIKETLK